MYGFAMIPLEARILYRRGLDLSEQGKDEAAVRYLRQAIIIAPRFAVAYRALGTCLSRLGREEDAADCQYRLATIAPDRGHGLAPAGA
ncbi:MAG: tetratricopeptide repeat protein [Methanoregula sp.]|nr:tetratricopeptide repeat protein [Methanoregula sp.]